MCSCIWLTPPRLAFSSYLRGSPSTNYYIWFNKVVVVVVVVVVDESVRYPGSVSFTDMDG